jgi:hypothetical protein
MTTNPHAIGQHGLRPGQGRTAGGQRPEPGK